MSMEGRSKAKVVASFVGVFVLGSVTGVAVDQFVAARRSLDVFDAAGEGSRHGVLLWSLERKLDLSDDQETKIKAIFADYDREMAAIPADPKTGALRQRMRADIRATLNPQQQAKYDDLMKAWDAKRRRPDTVGSSSADPASSASSRAPTAGP